MKLTIIKDGPHIKVELTTDASKKPLVMEVHESQLGSVLMAVELIRKSQKAAMTLEL